MHERLKAWNWEYDKNAKVINGKYQRKRKDVYKDSDDLRARMYRYEILAK